MLDDDAEILRKRALRTARTNRWRARHREAARKIARAHSKTPKAKATRKAYREKHRKRLNAKVREWRAANAESYRAKRRILGATERQRQRERMAADPAYAEQVKAKRKFFRLQWESRYPEKVKARNEIRLRRKTSDATKRYCEIERDTRAAKSQDVINRIAEMSGGVRAVELPVGPRDFLPPRTG
jgi:hypothetical protein